MVSPKTYMAKFVYALRNYGIRKTLNICWNFALRNRFSFQDKLEHIVFSFRLLRLYKTIQLVPGLLKKKTNVRALLKVSLPDSIDISGKYFCCYGAASDFSGSRTVVMAHWDPHNRVDHYVKYLCKHFKELGWRVVLSSANPVTLVAENSDHSDWVDAIVCRLCPGYDFTSWKAALHCFPSLFKCEALIICNDSFFGPVGSFENIFTQMQKVDCDFWGLTESRQRCPHLQSYYLLFRPLALRHTAFKDFFDAVPLCDDKDKAIRCELSLALWLALHGLRPGAVLPIQKHIRNDINPTLDFWNYLILIEIPVLKRERLRLTHEYGSSTGWNGILEEKGYPLKLISDYFLRLKEDISPSLCSGKRYPIFPPDVFSLQRPIDFQSCPSDNKQIVGVAVIMHCFYTEILPELCAYLNNIPTNAYIFVSTTSQQKAEEIRLALRPFSFAAVEVRILPNKGWDIMPFLVGFRDVLKKFDVVLKIHAKASLHLESHKAQEWRTLLYDALMGSKEKVHNIVAYLESNPACGILAPPSWLGLPVVSQGNNHYKMKQILKTKGIELPIDAAIDFPTGSMFWARAKAITPWLDLDLGVDDFDESNASIKDGTLAHAFERLFFFGCGIENMYWGRVFNTAVGDCPVEKQEESLIF